MMALALADFMLGGHGAVRIHGGGFGGTIQAFVPTDMVGEFARSMDKVLGDGATMICSVDHKGVCSEWL
jgi:galactokinase